jgi:hypothetical protein
MLTFYSSARKVFAHFMGNILSDKLEALTQKYPHAEAIMGLPSIPSPVWFSWSYDHSNMRTRVDEQGRVLMYRDVLVLWAGLIPPPGTELCLTRVDSYILAERPETRAIRLEEERQKELAKAEQRRQAERQALRDRQAHAERENAKLHIPVRWTSGQKRVLSGLTRNSSGTGENARTVNHILLLEPLTAGKFERSGGSFLCTSASGSNGRDWTDHRHSSDYGVDGKYVSLITCKQCLKLAGRWETATNWLAPELGEDHNNSYPIAF